MKTKGSSKTFDEGFEQFIMEHCTMKNFRPSTIKHYREMTKYSFYKFYDKDTILDKLEQKDINNYVMWLKKSDIREITINILLKGLKTVIKFFNNKGWIDSSIKVELIKADIEEMEAYTDEEISKLLVKPNLKNCSFTEYRSWVIINFLCNTGCRRSTLINIQITDLDLENGYCYYRHTKNRKAQTVPVSPSMCNILKEYVEYLPDECIYLFPTVLGEQIKVTTLTHALEVYNRSRNVQLILFCCVH
jgi:Site-specific recombinase XerD